MLWYIEQVRQGQNRDGYFLNRPMGFLYTPGLGKTPAFLPRISNSQLFSDFGWADAYLLEEGCYHACREVGSDMESLSC